MKSREESAENNVTMETEQVLVLVCVCAIALSCVHSLFAVCENSGGNWAERRRDTMDVRGFSLQSISSGCNKGVVDCWEYVMVSGFIFTVMELALTHTHTAADDRVEFPPFNLRFRRVAAIIICFLLSARVQNRKVWDSAV